MKSLRKIAAYSKMGLLYIKGKIVDERDFQDEYDMVSTTYHLWNQRMGQYTDKILNPVYLSGEKNGTRILDFACGRGYISSKLLTQAQECNGLRITGVDISKGMIDYCTGNIVDKRVRFINMDGLKYLSETDEKFDAIYCGWALCYLNYKKVLKLFDRVLKPGGILGVIVNSQGTLQDIEQIYLDVMCENVSCINKIMDIKFNLPDGRKELERWFEGFGLNALETGDGEEFVYFDKPQELYRWLRDTGAAAGMGKIFTRNEFVENELIKKIAQKRYINGKYMINHKFTYGIFRKR